MQTRRVRDARACQIVASTSVDYSALRAISAVDRDLAPPLRSRSRARDTHVRFLPLFPPYLLLDIREIPNGSRVSDLSPIYNQSVRVIFEKRERARQGEKVITFKRIDICVSRSKRLSVAGIGIPMALSTL